MMKYRGTEIYVAAVEWRLRILATSAACLVMFLPFYLNATACREVPTCVAEVTNAYPQRYHAFVSMGLVVILLREGTLLLVSATDWLLDPKKSQGLEFQDYLSQGLLCAILASLSSVEAYLATSELPLVHLGTVPVYSIHYLEWLVDVPLLMILTCCGALGRPLSEALGPILVTNGYIVVSWCTLFIEDFAVRWAVISHTFLAYAWASERMIQWVKDFWKEAKDVPCRGSRAASVILLIVVFGIYGVIYLLGCSGVISFATEHLGYTFMGFGCKVTLSILFASIRAYQTHQVLARLLGKLRGVSVAFVSLLRGTFDHVVPCTVTSEGQCYLPERSSREFHELERFLNQTVEVASFNDLLRHDEQGRFKDYVKNLLRQNDVSLSDSATMLSGPVAHAIHLRLPNQDDQPFSVMAHLSLVAKSSSGEAILALQMTSQELLAWADPTKLPEEGRVPYSSCTASTDDVSTEGRNGQKQSLTGTRDTDLSSGKISLDDGSIVGKNISYRRRKCDAKLLLKLLERRERRERRSKRKPKKPSKVKEAESADFNDQSSQQKVSFRCGGSDVRSQSSRLSAANSVVLACRQLLGPLHEHLPPPQYISRRMEDHLQCSAEMVKLKTCSEIARHRQKQEMDDWKAQAEAHQLSVMLAKSALPNNTQIPEQLWRSEVLENLKASHPGPRPEHEVLPTEEELWHKAWRRTYEESESESESESEGHR